MNYSPVNSQKLFTGDTIYLPGIFDYLDSFEESRWTTMEIPNSRDFSYAYLESTNMSNSFVSNADQNNKTLIDWIFS
jgi:hypothetical protein